MCVIIQWILLFLRIQHRKIAPVNIQKIFSNWREYSSYQIRKDRKIVSLNAIAQWCCKMRSFLQIFTHSDSFRCLSECSLFPNTSIYEDTCVSFNEISDKTTDIHLFLFFRYLFSPKKITQGCLFGSTLQKISLPVL